MLPVIGLSLFRKKMLAIEKGFLVRSRKGLKTERKVLNCILPGDICTECACVYVTGKHTPLIFERFLDYG
jgi:hypothetical protein